MSVKSKKTNSVLLLLAIFSAAINMRPAITSIGPMLDVIREELLLTNTQVSLLTSLPVICMGLFASLAPVLNRKLGLQKSMCILLLIIGVFTALRGFYSTYPLLILSAVVIGIAIAVMGPLLSAMIKQNFPDRTASVIGVYSFGMGVGATVSAGFTALFFERSNSYPFALSIWALLSIIGFSIWIMTGKKRINVKQSGQTTLKGPKSHSVSPWRIKKAWIFLIFFGLQSSAFFSIITWLVPIATSAGLSLLQAGTMLSAMTTVQIALNIILPILMQRFQARRNWILFLLVMGLLSIFLLWTGVYLLMWIGAILMGIPLGGLFPVALLLPLDETDSPDETNAWTAMMQTGGFIIGGLLPLLIALVFDWTGNHHYTFGIFIALFVSMIGLTFVIGNKK